jgi:DNA-binding NtrC family response regulator
VSKEKIFVIDDETNIRVTIQETLSDEGFQVEQFGNPKVALKSAARSMPDLVITDLVMPELNGLEVIQKLKEIHPEVSIVVITGHASLETAIGAIRAGADDYLVKPFKIEDLLVSVRKAMSQTRIIPGVTAKEKAFLEKYRVKNLIGGTVEMKELFRLIEKVAKSDSTVLIIGESGTGKEVVSRAVHCHSKRKKGPFVSINCAALPESLLESELFGYEKGAFTGAAASKQGLFELAAGGTFFLDEIGEMSANLQAKLLRVLQERNFKRVGGLRDIEVDFRLVAATSRNLPEEIKKKRFREDLYYRLNVIPFILPSLRDRKADIPVFVYFFLGFFANKQGIEYQFKISNEAMSVFLEYQWPGNVRELENVMERLVALSEKNEIDEDLARKVVYQTSNFSSQSGEPIVDTSNLRESVEAYERELIEKAVREAHGNKNQAARKLNLTRQALQYKIQKYRIAS